MTSDSDGERAVRWARASAVRALDPGRPSHAPGPDVGSLPRLFREPRGVFVTLKHHPSGELRGCIGYPLPVLPLGEAIRDVAVAAARDDPRFPPVEPDEWDRIVFEVSVLTVPQAVPSSSPEATLAAVRPGRDGLIVEGKGRSGLLLPQVATEQGWGAEEFLDGTCEKAGLPVGAWRAPGIRIRRFQAEVFRETVPNGVVTREPTEVTGANVPDGP
ncbi:MAG: TIGR00296 family protein [Thermoplasmata archaeon]|nr:TIGR00296 family protein [Thermoplasmata archaeon]